MKLTVDSHAYLSIPLSTLSGVVSSRAVLPEYGCVLISAKGSELDCTALNSQHNLVKRIDAEHIQVKEEGYAFVNYELLMAAITSIPGAVQLYTTEKSLMIRSVDNKRIKRRLPLANWEDMVKPPSSDGEGFSISASTLKSAISKVLFAAIKEGSRPELLGMAMGDTAMCGDGTRVASYNLGVGEVITIPVAAAMVMSTLLPSEGDVYITRGRWVQVDMPDTVFRFVKMQADFPESAGLLVETYKSRVPIATLTVTTSELVRVFEAVAVYVERAKSQGVAFATVVGDEKSVQVSVSAPDLGMFDDILNCEYEGAEFKILLSPLHIVELAGHSESGTIEIKIFSSLDPILISDVGSSDWVVVQTVMATKNMVKETKMEMRIYQNQEDEEEDF